MEIYPDLDMKRWEVSNSDGCILANADNYYTKYQVDKRLEGIIISGSVTSAQVETAIDEAVSGKVDSSDFEAFSASTYTALDNKLDASAYTPTDLSDYYTKEETNSQISSATADMATETWVENKHYITGVDLSNYATLSDIPTSNSGLTNDAGYATSGYVDTAVSVKADTSAVTADINAAVSGKQDTLSAGTNISITNNVISATDTTYSASNGIAIVSNEISLDLPLYKGSNNYAVSIGNVTGTAQGANQVKGTFSAAIGGGGLITNNSSEVAIGRYNVSTTAQSVTYGSSAKTSFSVGNGSGSNKKHNSFEIKENGDIYFADTNDSADYYSKPMIKLQDVNAALGGLKFVKLTQSAYDALSPNYDANTIYFIKD